MNRFRWQSFGDLRDDLARLQRELQRSLRSDSRTVEEVPADGFPPVNVWEDHDHVYVEAELPGYEQSDLEVLVHGRRLTLQGRRQPPQQDQGVWHRRERNYGPFARSLDLPSPVDPDQVEADLRSGVLSIRLAKHSEVRPRRILVKEA